MKIHNLEIQALSLFIRYVQINLVLYQGVISKFFQEILQAYQYVAVEKII
jgi:hypothetical protein